MTQSAIEAHGGRITVSSSGLAGEGTLFVVEVPRRAPHSK
jgi:signal transduction histidine kinase